MTALKIILIVLAVLLLLYLLAIKPRMSKRREKSKFAGVYYAHRGLHSNNGEIPENSIPAFRKAVKRGYGIELDVQLSKDGVPVVFHDFTLERMCGKEGKVCEYTYEELQQFVLAGGEEKIPGFTDVLDVIGGKVPLIVELKVEWMDITVCPVVDSILRKYKGVYCIESFNPMALSWYRRYHNDVFRGQLADAFIKTGEYKGALYWCLQNLLLNWMTRPDFIAYNHENQGNLSRKLCRGLFRNTAVAWTIRSQAELEKAKKHFDIFIFESFNPKKG